MLTKRILTGLSVKTLEKLLASKKRIVALAPLEKKRAMLLRELKQVDDRMARLSGNAAKKRSRARKPKFSPEARRKISLAQKRRWAKAKSLKKAEPAAN